jgi:hypothetical protein
MGPQPSERDTSETGVTNVDAIAQQRTIYQLGARTRQGVYADADEMDHTPEFTRSLHTIANNVCASEDGEQQSFAVECEDAGALAVLDEVVEQADLHRMMPSWTRRTVKYGDGFAEIVVNGDLDVVGIKQLSSGTMNRNEDEFGNLRLGEPAYDGATCTNDRDFCAFDQTDKQGKNVVAGFYPWQIVHTRLFWDGVALYGVSLADAGRNKWRQLNSLENSMVIARVTRAYLKLIVYADRTGKSDAEAKAMLQQIQKALSQTGPSTDQKRNHELSVLDNIFMTTGYVRPAGSSEAKPNLTKVDLIDPKNEGLTSLDDVLHHHRQYTSSLFVPRSLIGFEEDVNAKATLSGEALQFARFLRSTQGLMGAGLEQVFDTALILKGYDPDQVDYEINWPVISSEDEQQMAVANFQQAQADDIYLQAGAIDKVWVQKHRFDMDDDDIADIEEPEPEAAPVLPVVSKVQPQPAAPVAAEKRERIMPALEVLAVAQQRILDKIDAPRELVAENGNGHTATRTDLVYGADGRVASVIETDVEA